MKQNIYRTHMCGLISEKEIGNTVTVSGWVANIRDHGGVIFVDLRDRTGYLQTVSNDEHIFDGLTKESVVTLKGTIRKRDAETVNDKISTGTIELLVDELKVITKSKNELPFEIMSSKTVSEDVRLKYRYLDLRNEKVRDNMFLRAEILHYLRNMMYELGFTEVQTPILTASSPEGARDFIVPSRKFHGKFYALPQAPQIYKQLLMVSGFDKYYQIAPCFRDEDTRADRTLEFYQLDFEMSFATEEDVYEIGEEIFYNVFTKFSDKEVSPRPFRRIPYREAIAKYGTDKPDLRNPLIIQNITKILEDTTFKPFVGSNINGIVVDGIGDKSNSWFNELVDYASSIGMPGIGYITLQADGTFKGPIDKFLTDDEREDLINELNLKENSVLFFVADRNYNKACKFAGLIRDELGRKLDLIDKNKLELCIVNDFPMFEYNEEEEKYDFGHNPFSMPQCSMEDLDKANLDDILAYQYDFVCNGCEMASGAVRNHDIDCLEKCFGLVGYSKEVVEDKFKSLYNAFKYGVPPHAGMAPGIDRMIMLINDEPNLREVQVFPTSASGADLMMGSPTEVSETQLREVHIKVRDKN